VEDGVEANIAKIGDLLHSAHVLAITLAQGEDGAAGAEHLFPEMGKGRGGRLGIDVDGFLTDRRQRTREEEGREAQ